MAKKKQAAEAKKSSAQGREPTGRAQFETNPEPVPIGTAVFVDWPPGPPKLGVLVKYNKGKLGPCPVVRIARVDAKGRYTGEMGAPRVFELKDLVGPAVPLHALEIGITESAAQCDARIEAMAETGIARALYRRQALLRGEKLADYEVDGVDAEGRKKIEPQHKRSDHDGDGPCAACEPGEVDVDDEPFVPNYPDPNELVDKLLDEDIARGSKQAAKVKQQRAGRKAKSEPAAETITYGTNGLPTVALESTGKPRSGELIDVRIGKTSVWERCRVIAVEGTYVGFTALDDDTRGLRELKDEGKTWKRLGVDELEAHAAMSVPPPELVKPVPPELVATARQIAAQRSPKIGAPALPARKKKAEAGSEPDPRGTPRIGDPLVLTRNDRGTGAVSIPVTVHKVDGTEIGVTYGTDGALDLVHAEPWDMTWRRPTDAELRVWPKVGVRASKPAESPPDSEAMASGAEKERREVERQGERALRKATGAKKQSPVQKAAAGAGMTMEGNVIVERGVQRSEPIMMYNDSQPGDPVKLVALGKPQPLPPAVDVNVDDIKIIQAEETTLGDPPAVGWRDQQPNRICEHCGEAVRGGDFHRCDQMMGFDESPPFEVDETPPWEA